MAFEPDKWANLVAATAWLSAVIVVGVALYKGAQKINYNQASKEFSIEMGTQGSIDTKLYAPIMGGVGTARAGDPNPDTVWVSNCPSGTKVISGYCIAQKSKSNNPVYLQNVGISPGTEQWHCVWSAPMERADVRALCLASK
jgi:hypothetical protein